MVDNEREALALENNLIKQHKPKFNVMLRDDKTYPYIRYTAFEKFPRVYVTRRLKKDGSLYFGPYFPHSLAHRIVHFIHRTFQGAVVHRGFDARAPAAVFAVLHSPLPGAVRAGADDGRALRGSGARRAHFSWRASAQELSASLQRTDGACVRRRKVRSRPARIAICCARSKKLTSGRKLPRRRATTRTCSAWYAEPPQVAANLFHVRGGRVVDRRDFYWEDLEEFDPAEFLPSLLKQLYLDANYLPRVIHVPMDFEERELLEEVLTRARRTSRGNSYAAARAEARVSGVWWRKTRNIRSTSDSAC